VKHSPVRKHVRCQGRTITNTTTQDTAAPDLRRRVYDLLNRPGTRWLLAGYRSIELTIFRGEPCLVRPLSIGGWLHHYRGVALAMPTPSGPSLRDVNETTDGVFLHRAVLHPGDVVLDIGAGYGSEIVTFARLVGPEGRVIAVEAHPAVAALLRRTVAANRLGNVQVVQSAISDGDGCVMLSDDEAMGYEANHIVSSGSGIEVRAETLDGLLQRLGLARVDLLKMNIEGAEREAVAGLVACAPRVRRAVVGCHDFLAEKGGDEAFRTQAEVETGLRRLGFATSRRDDPCEWVANYVYAHRP